MLRSDNLVTLKGAKISRHTGAAHPEHYRQEVVSHWNVAIDTVVGHEQPPREAFDNGIVAVRESSLGDLDHEDTGVVQ